MFPAPRAARRIRQPVFATVLAMGVLSLALPGSASAERLPIKRYTSADGLPHDRIKCIVQDSRGFLWICTARGLSRFDGARFVNFSVEQGLPSPSINDLRERRDGSYWVATNGGGVVLMSYEGRQPRANATYPTTGAKFQHFSMGPLPRANRVNAMYEDREGRVWAGTDAGVFVLAPQGAGGFQQVPLRVSDRLETSLQIWDFVQDRFGALWIGTSAGVVVRESDGSIVHLPVRPLQGTDTIGDLAVDQSGRIWAAHAKGLIVYARSSPSDPIASDAQWMRPLDGLRPGGFSALHISASGAIWAAGAAGLVKLDGSESKPYGESQGLSDEAVTAVTEDRVGNVWIGTISSGLQRIARSGFTTYAKADGLDDSLVSNIIESPAGEVYIATSRNLLHRFDGRRFFSLRPNLPAKLVDRGRRTVALIDRRGELWVPTGVGLYRFPAVQRFEKWSVVLPIGLYTTANGLADNDVYRLFEDSRGDIWIGAWSPGEEVVTRWERRTGSFHRYSTSSGLPAYHTPNAFAEDGSGAVWIGFREGALIRYRGGQFTRVQVPLPAYGGVAQMLADRVGRLWIASVAGATRIDEPAADVPTTRTYTETDGLSTRLITAMAEDNWGRMYFGSSAGVDRLDVRTGRITHYTSTDGLTGKEMIFARSDRNGALWFALYDGVARLVPDPPREEMPPSVFIADVRVAGTSVAADDRGIADIRGLALNPDGNQVRIEYFGLASRLDETLRYEYRLDGADSAWSPPTSERFVTYPRLAPGRYRFLVRAIASGVSSASAASVSFTVLPPMWQRWWFIAASLTAMAGAIYGLSRYRLTRQLELARIRARIATDLHDDVGSSLSQIAILSEVAQRNADGNVRIHDPLQKISATSRELVDTMSDIVWAINPERDSLRDLTYRMRRFASDTLTAAQIEFRFTPSGTEDTTHAGAHIRRDVYLMFKESLNNVVRHSRARFVAINFRVVREALVLEVKDDGIGFVDDPENPGHGLRSLRRRAQALGGCVRVESACGAGTRLLFSIPIGRAPRRAALPE